MPTLATCHTDGCGNAGMPIDVTDLLDTDPAPSLVMCGVCGVTIEDVRDDGA